MSKIDKSKIMLAEHVLEVRHVALGSFLNIRGLVADYIKDQNKFPHWRIDSNTVHFQDAADGVKKEGAFAGYKNAGYISLNPPTHNYFVDRATSFWNTLLDNKHYKIPQIKRFGVRTKVFIPIKEPFNKINTRFYNLFFNKKAQSILGDQENDVQIIVEVNQSEFEVKVIGGPVHENEVEKHLRFKTKEFEQCGVFLDFDFYSTNNISIQNIPTLLKRATDLTWSKAEMIVSSMGF